MPSIPIPSCNWLLKLFSCHALSTKLKSQSPRHSDCGMGGRNASSHSKSTYRWSKGNNSCSEVISWPKFRISYRFYYEQKIMAGRQLFTNLRLGCKIMILSGIVNNFFANTNILFISSHTYKLTSTTHTHGSDPDWFNFSLPSSLFSSFRLLHTFSWIAFLPFTTSLAD